MPRTNIAHQEITRAGVAVTESAADVTNGNKTPYHPRLDFQVRNAHATLAKTFTLRVQKAIDGLTITHRIVSIPAVSTRHIGPPSEDYRNSADEIEFDGETVDINVAVIRIP